MLPVKRSLVPTVSRFFDDDWNSVFNWANRDYSTPMSTSPSVNIKENDDEYIVEMAAPGMKKEDFHIELNQNVLTIKSLLQDEQDLENEDFTRREFKYHSFMRSFNLNNKVVDDAKIEASYSNGILLISLPKKEEAKKKPARQIHIS